jgi:phospholipid/cholesterol/gamma-HCH transport system permease protein
VSAGGRGVADRVEFLGAALIGLRRLLRRGPAPVAELLARPLREAGAESLPIVALIGFVAGLVLTLLGAKELAKIGVDVAVPRLVGIVVLREIGPLIVGIALAGRVAPSFAAELAASSEERRRRAAPDDFAVEVAPRVLALVLAGPVLLAYANAMAVAGAAAYGADAAAVLSALTPKHVIAGFTKAAAFGFAAAFVGCYHGLRASAAPRAVAGAVRRSVVAAVIGVGVAETALIFAFKWIRF